ncbi:MAG: hypothetical protein HY904_04125 [Deltaproteobacteria bacterium]|nr:hypothetical protein [Deltaproteobacteria bacterium]
MASVQGDVVGARNRWNASRYDPANRRGHFESYFQRGNHPTRPLAFWLRYTNFVPVGKPEAAEGELWAMWFDGEKGTVVREYRALPMAQCDFSRAGLSVRVGDAKLDDTTVVGSVGSMAWDLRYSGKSPPLLLYPESWYSAPFPKTKIVVGTPHALYTGTVRVGGEEHSVDAWPGSQAHVWAPVHAEFYAWGQVYGFDDHPEAALEWATGKLKVGPFRLPPLTGGVLRLDGRDHALNSIGAALRAKGHFQDHRWEFSASTPELALRGVMSAPAAHFARLEYRNPPGGTKTCLNTKIARCELWVTRPGQPELHLVSPCRGAFELLGEASALAALGF